MPMNNALLGLYDYERVDLYRENEDGDRISRLHVCEVPKERATALRPAVGAAWKGDTAALNETVTEVTPEPVDSSDRVYLKIQTVAMAKTQRL